MDPTLKTRTISNLKKAVPELSPRLKTVAKYIVDHPSEFGLDPIRETARKCGVSTYTLVRLAEQMGFAGYDELREPFRHALVSTIRTEQSADWIDNLREDGPLGQIQADASSNTMAIVEQSLRRQSAQVLQNAATMLLQARNVYLTAVRASYSLAYYFHYIGRMALPTLQLVPRHFNSAIDELNDANDEDVMIAITFTPYSRETIEACSFARKKGVRLIVLSDSDVISPDFTADISLIASQISTHHFGCYSGAMAIFENLLALLVAQGGEDAMKRIESYERARAENNAYWVANKKH